MKKNAPPTFSDDELKIPDNSVETSFSSPKIRSNNRAYMPYMLASMIILLLLILAGLFYWQLLIKKTEIVPSNSLRPTAAQNKEPESTTARAQTDATLTTSTSDELSAIEADIESTDLETLDSEINAINAELETVAEAQQ
ncbi:hypothetical protein KC845_00295 [Candidatus Kaiserbacteria bacterium]|nr:hypothetical protein [Candidatus Kaiserbacteria bacterium]